MSLFPNDSQWAAVRALAEGALPTHARLAAALHVGVPAVSHRAMREGWALLDFRRTDVRAGYAELMERIGRVADPGDGGSGKKGKAARRPGPEKGGEV